MDKLKRYIEHINFGYLINQMLGISLNFTRSIIFDSNFNTLNQQFLIWSKFTPEDKFPCLRD